MNAARKYDILPINHKDYDEFEFATPVKGLTMSHKRTLSNYAEELVAQFAKFDGEDYILCLSSIPEDEKGELAKLYMDSTDRETGECVHGLDISIENEYTCALLSMLQNNTQENRENYAEVTRKNIILYYEKSLQRVIDDACNAYLYSINAEAGCYAHQDMDHGDIYWSKFR